MNLETIPVEKVEIEKIPTSSLLMTVIDDLYKEITEIKQQLQALQNDVELLAEKKEG